MGVSRPIFDRLAGALASPKRSASVGSEGVGAPSPRRRPARLLAATAASALALAIIAAVALAATGDLTQKADPNGCIVNEPSTAITGCDNTGKALNAAASVTVSPDGASVYVASRY